eukprot:716063-Hanusia_phi.AAC.1
MLDTEGDAVGGLIYHEVVQVEQRKIDQPGYSLDPQLARCHVLLARSRAGLAVPEDEAEDRGAGDHAVADESWELGAEKSVDLVAGHELGMK